nr:hypothetical protein Q903MT_gene609 [Picea sitchensis]
MFLTPPSPLIIPLTMLHLALPHWPFTYTIEIYYLHQHLAQLFRNPHI